MHKNINLFKEDNRKTSPFMLGTDSENKDDKFLDNERFIQSFTACEGILCGAGFETPAEALYLNKKLMVIPMKNQYEQHCNAAALKVLGIPVIKNMKKKQLTKIEDWIQHGRPLEVHYPDITEDIIDMLIEKHT